ncbi:hypothetical protein T492DRAFT_996897 [Pavlovales sp. CCMP2436]|nr:hypothetical protein T492DRAFT_996897 [Pavlovales sp. CCMP2436]
MPGWPRWLRMPGWPHGPLSPRARTRSEGEGLLARCTQPRRPRAGATCCGEARKACCGEARAAAHNARTSSWERRPDSRRSTSAEREVAVRLGQLSLAAPRR